LVKTEQPRTKIKRVCGIVGLEEVNNTTKKRPPHLGTTYRTTEEKRKTLRKKTAGTQTKVCRGNQFAPTRKKSLG